MKTITWLSPLDAPERFPAIEQALDDPPGLLAAGGDLSPSRLIAAYRRGIFPWYSAGQPVLWWSPDPREVLFPQEFRRTRSLGKSQRNRGFVTRLDHAFAEVVARCAAPRESSFGTWLTPEMQRAYVALHERGLAHSVETWRGDELVGGLYGIQLGRVFFGESMFSRERDASKVAFARLVEQALARGIVAIDCQLASAHLKSLGSRAVPREAFRQLLAKHASPAVANVWLPRDAGQPR
jgi:leucyl/phenylalanyl-tRNA--protein transferase